MPAPERSVLVRAIGQRFEALLEAAPDAMVVVGADGEMVLVNGQTERLFGYARHELLGQRVEMLVPERLRDVHPRHRERYADEARPRPMGMDLELLGLRKDGSEFPTEISLSPVDTGAGRLVIAAIRDVSARKRAELERRDLLAREQAARVAAEAATRARDDVLAVVSHDLQNLLNAIGLTLTVLLRTPAVTEAERRMRQCGEVVERSLGTMKRLLRDILEAQRIESAQLQVSMTPEELTGLVRESVELMQPLAAEKQIRVTLRLDCGPAQALCERERIQQVIHNLVGNAIHYTPDGREVVVRVWRDGGEMLVSVADAGPGIPANQLPFVFDRYWRGRGASRHGIGLGLFIVHRLIAAHGGRTWVESAPGAGATFVFTLQFAAEGPDADQG